MSRGLRQKLGCVIMKWKTSTHDNVAHRISESQYFETDVPCSCLIKMKMIRIDICQNFLIPSRLVACFLLKKHKYVNVSIWDWRIWIIVWVIKWKCTPVTACSPVSRVMLGDVDSVNWGKNGKSFDKVNKILSQLRVCCIISCDPYYSQVLGGGWPW